MLHFSCFIFTCEKLVRTRRHRHCLTMVRELVAIFKLASAVFCAILCGFQLQLVFVQYFAYDVTSEISVRFSKNDTPPGVMVCVKLNIEVFQRESPKTVNDLSPGFFDLIHFMFIKTGRSQQDKVFLSRDHPFTDLVDISKSVSKVDCIYKVGHKSNLRIWPTFITSISIDLSLWQFRSDHVGQRWSCLWW